MRPRGMALGLLVLASLVLSGGAGAEDQPYLEAAVDVPDAYTWDVVTVRVESRVWGLNETGALALVPSNHLVNLTVSDAADGVTVRSGALPLFLGRGNWTFAIEPEWTTARLLVTVTDSREALQDVAEVRTHMSDAYLLARNDALIQRNLAEPVAALLAEMRAQRDGYLLFSLSVVALSLFLLVVLFLRLEHRLARESDPPRVSLADRLRRRLFPWSLTDMFLDEYFDPERTWDRDAALQWTNHRKEAHIRHLRRDQEGIDREIEALEDDVARSRRFPRDPGQEAGA